MGLEEGTLEAVAIDQWVGQNFNILTTNMTILGHTNPNLMNISPIKIYS